MAVVAVFEIHMDRNIVVNMKPSINLPMQYQLFYIRSVKNQQ